MPRALSWATRFELRQSVKGSMWVLPLLGLGAGALLAQAAILADSSLRVPPGWTYSASTASGVLTAIVGAMVALLGFVVTIGVLVVQQATGTLSPRYMRLWYRDRLQKVVLATFAGTFAFAFSLLRRVETDFVPDIGVTTAGVAVAASLALLLIYLDRFTHRLRPVAVAAIVGQAGQDVLARLGEHAHARPVVDQPAAAPRGEPVLVVPAGRAGAVQAVNVPALVAMAERLDCTFVLVRTVGDFVARGTPLIEVHGAAPPSDGHLQGLFALGRERTIEQDPSFALRVLVDIAIKALSPAINDPTTAVQVLDHIEAFLEAVAGTRLRRQYVLAGRDGTARVVLPGRDWAEYLQLAVTEIREYGAASTQVCRRLRALLDGLLDTVPPDRRPAVLDELRRLDSSVDTAFADLARRSLARCSDRQGIGGRVADAAVTAPDGRRTSSA
ncbi:DUF2254 domain-containing protein [Pseudonocardia yunnanensis]|uniref:DUF2254 domain-containing protein n=1 Tax=Pseudonocardia yunnanensis TaxID=58107 RepID=A0ABW4ENM9_9PSEU